MRIEGTPDNLVKVVLAGAHRPWLDENRRPRSQKSMSIPLTSAARRSGPRERARAPVSFLRSRWRQRVMAGVYLSKDLRERERAARGEKRERKRVARRVELYRSRWGADTDRACYRPQFKSNLRHDRISWSLVAWLPSVNERARID